MPVRITPHEIHVDTIIPAPPQHVYGSSMLQLRFPYLKRPI